MAYNFGIYSPFSPFARPPRSPEFATRAGGDVFICTDLDEKGEEVRTPYLADTFEIVRYGNHADFAKGGPDFQWSILLSLLNSISTEKTIPHLHLKGTTVSYPWMVEYYKHKQTLRYLEDVPELDDDSIRLDDYPQNCREKKHLAIQHRDSQVIDTNIGLLFKITSFERTMFEYHEVRIALRNRWEKDTTLIRQSILRLVRDERMTLQALSHEVSARTIRARNPGTKMQTSLSWVNMKILILIQSTVNRVCKTKEKNSSPKRFCSASNPASCFITIKTT